MGGGIRHWRSLVSPDHNVAFSRDASSHASHRERAARRPQARNPLNPVIFGSLRTGCKEVPAAGNSFELIGPPFVEFQPCSRYEIRDYAGYENLLGSGIGHDPGSCVDGDSADVAASDLDFSGM